MPPSSFQGCFALIAARTGHEVVKIASEFTMQSRARGTSKIFPQLLQRNGDSRLPELLISIANVRRNSVKNEAAEGAPLGKKVLRSDIKPRSKVVRGDFFTRDMFVIPIISIINICF